MEIDLKGKTVLVTGGTRGIGLETGLSFAKRGAFCALTYRWGEHDEKEILQEFKKCGGPAPLIIQADASKNEDTISLLNQIKEKTKKIDVFISNVSVAAPVQKFDDLALKSLKRSEERRV